MDNIIVSFNVIAPVFFLMVLGYFLVNYTSLADGKLTKQANAIVFKIFLPCMLFYNVYQSDIGSEIHSRIRLCIWAAGGLLILFVLLCLIVPRIVTQENQQGVVIQGIFRSNYVIFGVAVVQNMYGPKSTTTAAILSAILVPMYNFLAVVALSIFGEKRENDWKKIILDIIKTLGLRKGGIEVVSCPTCGRTKIDLIGLANQVQDMVADIPLDIKVAVMGCVVNGPGEAKEADIGIAGGCGEGLLIKKGEIVKKVKEEELLETLRQELLHWNE